MPFDRLVLVRRLHLGGPNEIGWQTNHRHESLPAITSFPTHFEMLRFPAGFARPVVVPATIVGFAS